jgi:putative transcriptional regulator
MAYLVAVVFVETPIFYRRVQQLMDDDEYAEMQAIDAMKKALFEELLESVKQARAIERGELKPARVVRINPKTEIVRVRGKLGLSQSKFAAILGISADTLQNWEQGRRSPTGPAKVLLKIAAKHPEVLLEVA